MQRGTRSNHSGCPSSFVLSNRLEQGAWQKHIDLNNSSKKSPVDIDEKSESYYFFLNNEKYSVFNFPDFTCKI